MSVTIMKGSKPECIRKMLELEAVHGRNFWVVSMDDAANTYELQCSESIAHLFATTTNITPPGCLF